MNFSLSKTKLQLNAGAQSSRSTDYLSHSLFDDTKNYSIYTELANHGGIHDKTVENKFLPEIMRMQSTINKLVDDSFSLSYENRIEQRKPRHRKSCFRGNFFPRKSQVERHAFCINKKNPYTLQKTTTSPETFSHNRTSFCPDCTNQISNRDKHNSIYNKMTKKCASSLPQLSFSFLNDQRTLMVNNRSQGVIHESPIEKDAEDKEEVSLINSTREVENTSEPFRKLKKLPKKYLDPNYVIKQMHEKCLEHMAKDNNLIQNMNLNKVIGNRTEKLSNNNGQANKNNIYSKLNSETMNLLQDNTKWVPLSKKMESAMDIASKYTINLVMSHRSALTKQFKEKKKEGGYLFNKEGNIHNNNIYMKKLIQISQKKKLKKAKESISVVSVINDTIKEKALLMKRLDENNKRYLKDKMKSTDKDYYCKVSNYFSATNLKKKKQIKRGEVLYNKSI